MIGGALGAFDSELEFAFAFAFETLTVATGCEDGTLGATGTGLADFIPRAVAEIGLSGTEPGTGGFEAGGLGGIFNWVCWPSKIVRRVVDETVYE